MQQYYSNLGRRNTMADPTSRAQWYFYNPTTVSQGIGEFQVKWGRRSLEDNWRRQNKGTAEMSMAAGNDDNDNQTAGLRKIEDAQTPAFYLQNVPLTDSMMRVSHRIIEESLYVSGYIYNNDFDEYALAAAQYEDLLRRYPGSEYIIPSYYYLYMLYNKLGKSAETERYRNLLMERAPESVYAKIILDPTYLDKLAQQKGESEQLYEQVYQLYNNGEYHLVINLANDALARFAKDALAPMFAYLKAIATGKIVGTNEAMRNEMRSITTEYPGTEVAIAAQNLINFIDDEEPELRVVEQVERAKALYEFTQTGAFYFIWMIDSREDINQLSFDVQSFYIERFTNVPLEFERNRINERSVLLMVKGFDDLPRAQAFLRTFMMDIDAMKHARYQNTPFLISEDNYATLAEEKNIEDYIEFFKKEYLKQ